MITPKLEELILCGKAFFKTFVAGGDKHTLSFGNDRFIIITDITYFPMNVPTNDETGTYDNKNTQVAIYGERGYNHFIFRNYLNDPAPRISGICSPITIHTYILHDQQVGFSFCNAPGFTNFSFGVANTQNPAYAPPLEFGKDGQPGAVPVLLTADSQPGLLQNNFTTRPAAGVSESQQLFFSFDASKQFGPNLPNNSEYPLLHVNYVEVLGSSNNIQI
jgi:hypothetical protein